MHARIWTFLLTACLLGACAPSLSPLYRDYEIGAQSTAMDGRIQTALTEAGWQVASSSTPDVVATEARTLNNWVLYKVEASLEVVPMGGDYVRVYIHAYRKYFTGNRSKIPYLKRNLRYSFLTDLNEAFEEQGLSAIGDPRTVSKQTASR